MKATLGAYKIKSKIAPFLKHKEFKDLLKTGLSLDSLVAQRISVGYLGTRKLRNDAVKCVRFSIAGAPSVLEELCNNGKIDEWAHSNYDFIASEFGKENIVAFLVRVDVDTPIIYCFLVPLTSDGRLSAKEVVGNKENLFKLQEKYSNQMKVFGFSNHEANFPLENPKKKGFWNSFK